MKNTNNKNNAHSGGNLKGANVELIVSPTAPRRDGFDIARFRTALKQAENVKDPKRALLYDIYNEITTDAHYIAVSDKRIDNIKAAEIIFTENGKSNEKIDDLISMTWFREMLCDIVNSIFWGHSAMWLDLSGSLFHKYNLLPRKHIIPEQRLFITKQDDKTGINYTAAPYDRYVLTAGKNNSLGLILSVVPWVLLKRGDINDWSTFLEVFAAPFRKGKYPQYNEKAKEALAQACSSIGSMSWAIIPNETDLELIQSQAAGSTTAYREFAEFCDKQISKAFLHNTMTTDAEGGKYKGDIHEQSESGVLKSDIQFVVSVLNDKLLPLLEMHGFAPGKGKFSVVDEEHLCIKDRIGVDVQLNSIIDIPAEYFYKRYNIPVPKGGAKKIEQTKISLTDQSSYNSVEIPDKKRTIVDTVKDFFV